MFWVCLPQQRAAVLRRITEGGYAALGLEVMSGQQLYYRLLAHGERLRPLVTGNERLIRVAQALAEVIGALPSPGEARLYSYGIAEAKRYGLSAADIADPESEPDPEIARLALVFGAYEQALGDDWDYDDVRTQAVALAAADPDACEADVLIVDGLREIGPLELRLYSALAETKSVHMSLTESPPGLVPSRVLERPPLQDGAIQRYLLPNPVAELRFVMGSLKRDLLETGLDALDLAVVVPRGTAPAAVALAEEYGVPLMDETPVALADTPAGSALLDLVELAQQPTPSRLLAVPELTPLANAALRAGVAGEDALATLARSLGLQDVWREWSARLTAPEDGSESVGWALRLLDEQLPAALGEEPPADLKSRAARLAQEASRLGATGLAFQSWWAALLRDTRSRRSEPGGVALLEVDQASGRRFKKLYVLGATEDAYRGREGEDYFVPEEDRLPLARSFEELGLPQRFQGRERFLYDELLHGSDSVVVTAPTADQAGELTPSAALLLPEGAPLPPAPPNLPAASRSELALDEGFLPASGTVSLPPLTLSRLKRYAECGFRFWAEELVFGPDAPLETTWDGPERTRSLRAALVARGTHTAQDLESLAAVYPQAATWLLQYVDELQRLKFGQTFTDSSTGLDATVDAGGRRDLGARGRTAVQLYRFVPPRESAFEWQEARDEFNKSSDELWAAIKILGHSQQAPALVEFFLWPLLGAPYRFTDSGQPFTSRQLNELKAQLAASAPQYQRGEVTPRPGYQCEDCPAFDICRLGVRA